MSLDNLSTEGMLSAPVAVDAMGGDHGHSVVVEGALRAASQFGIAVTIVGNQKDIQESLDKFGVPASISDLVKVEHAPEVVSMDDSPSKVIRGKTSSSIRIAFELIKAGKASAVVSAGNTGAVMAAGLFVSGTIPGISRPAIATLIPKVGDLPPTVLLDSGANIDCQASQLVEFAVMGSYYAQSVLNYAKPRVALLSNGSEASKGTDTLRATAMALSQMPAINFIGYVEGRDLGRDKADVVVCDGFVGNIVLKAMEGTVELVFDSIKHAVKTSTVAKLGMYFAKPALKKLAHEKLDPAAYGGAPLLGLQGAAIICHGGSGARAICNAVQVANKFVVGQVAQKIGAAVSDFVLNTSGSYGDGVWNRAGVKLDGNSKQFKKT